MKKEVLKFEHFLVWVFKMNAGERKVLKSIETTRGLTDHGPHTLNSISVFTKGSFHTIRDGLPPVLHKSGTGGARFLEAKSMMGHALVALEDGSEYHCITPRDKTPRFWDRLVYPCKQGQVISILPGRHAYFVTWDRASMVVNTSKEVRQVQVENDCMLALMWINDKPKISA